MKRALFFLILAGLVTSVQAQYSATKLTRKVVPQQPAPAAPARPAPVAPGVRAVGPVQTVPQQTEAQKSEADKKLFEYQKSRAEKGSETAQFDLAMRYLTGRGVEKDDKLGREWLEKAAKNGHTVAAKKLAELKPLPAPTPAPAEGQAPK